jgi:hypothetical protein
MVIMSCRLRHSALRALHEALGYAKSLYKLEAHHKAETDPTLMGTAVSDMMVLDLSELAPDVVLQIATDKLESNPFVRCVVVPGTLNAVTRPQDLIALGRAGVICPPSEGHALHPTWWVAEVVSLASLEIIDRAWDSLEEVTPGGDAGSLVKRIAVEYTCQSVKTLALRIYPAYGTAGEIARQRLYKECKQVGFVSPEAVHQAVRLWMLKHFLDTDCWPNTRLAKHFGADTTAKFSEYTKRRFGLSLGSLRAFPMQDVRHKVTSVLQYGAGVEVLRCAPVTASEIADITQYAAAADSEIAWNIYNNGE